MKKNKFKYFVLCLIQIISCYSQKKRNLEYQNDKLLNELGIGLIQQVDVSEKITLYNDASCNKIKKKDATLGKDIIPLLNKIDYSILFFVCVEKNDKFYKIVISSGTYSYLKASNKLIFYNWNDFLKNQVSSVESKNKNSNPLYNKIKGKQIKFNNLQDDDEIEITAIKDDWLNINNTTINKKYWIKWKEKNELLIYLNLLM